MPTEFIGSTDGWHGIHKSKGIGMASTQSTVYEDYKKEANMSTYRHIHRESANPNQLDIAVSKISTIGATETG
jgi:hypothetical protein